MKYSSDREKAVLLTSYKEKVDDLREYVYRVIKLAAELERPHDELERLILLSKGFEGKWWSLDNDIKKARGEKD